MLNVCCVRSGRRQQCRKLREAGWDAEGECRDDDGAIMRQIRQQMSIIIFSPGSFACSSSFV